MFVNRKMPSSDALKIVIYLHSDSYYIITFNLFLRLMDIAKEMTRESLPIKCLEAVILGMYPSLWNSLKHGLNILSIYNENNREPNTEPCGTP